MGVLCLLVELHREESAPAACAAGFFSSFSGDFRAQESEIDSESNRDTQDSKESGDHI